MQHDTLLPVLESFSETVVSLIERPAAVIADGEVVLAHNEPWSRATRRTIGSSRRDTLEQNLRNFDSADALVAALRKGSPSVGVVTLQRSPIVGAPDEGERTFVARWRQLDMRPVSRSYTVVVLQDPNDADPAGAIMAEQKAQIARLLIRQTLIEQKERRRIGQALHDSVAQEMALIREAVRTSERAPDTAARIVSMIDHVIAEVGTLTFDLSPPVLEDLGLRPALRWLAEHLSKRHETVITFVDNDNDTEPRLSRTTRTIVFRTMRELLTNAAKHAPGAEIVASCVANKHVARFIVLDTGPGFRADDAGETDGQHKYGLLSVEQQVRGIGGSFELVSIVGEGTRVTITVPIEP